ncbi:hypothetical protein [Herbiconiux liukaitaii]|uniref:hypothetical protein n=1 Tax=Herbiconiux liukaitaii TaxID=3342799 RepID=UPI0035BAE6E4
MTPRAAGWLAVGGSGVLAVLGGLVIATPPWSILGALVLVAATIVLSLGTVWLHRRSWSDPWPPDVAPSLQTQLKLARVREVVNCVLLVAMVALAVYAAVTQNWWQLLFVGFFALLGLSNLSLNRRTQHLLRDTASGAGPGGSGGVPSGHDGSRR